jgi:hypothetical protein
MVRVVRLAMAALLLCVAALAQKTTVAEAQLTDGAGHPAAGYFQVRPAAAFTAVDGTRVETVWLRVPVVNGAFAVSLEPNIAGTSYQVQWQLNGGVARTEYFVVPASADTLGVADVVVKVPPSPVFTIQWSQMAQNGAVATNVPMWDGQHWVPGSVLNGFSFALFAPSTQDSGSLQHETSTPYQLVSVSCSTDHDAATINLDVRTEGSPNTAGAAVLASPLVCTSAGTATGAPASPLAIAANTPVALQVLGTAGLPGVVRVHVSAQ